MRSMLAAPVRSKESLDICTLHGCVQNTNVAYTRAYALGLHPTATTPTPPCAQFCTARLPAHKRKIKTLFIAARSYVIDSSSSFDGPHGTSFSFVRTVRLYIFNINNILSKVPTEKYKNTRRHEYTSQFLGSQLTSNPPTQQIVIVERVEDNAIIGDGGSEDSRVYNGARMRYANNNYYLYRSRACDNAQL